MPVPIRGCEVWYKQGERTLPPLLWVGGSSFAITFPLTPSKHSLPFPIISHSIFCSLCLLIYRPLIYSSPYPLHHSPSPHMNTLPVFHTYLNSTCIFTFPFPFSPSKQFPPLHWGLNTRLNSRNGISNDIDRNRYIVKWQVAQEKRSVTWSVWCSRPTTWKISLTMLLGTCSGATCTLSLTDWNSHNYMHAKVRKELQLPTRHSRPYLSHPLVHEPW